VRAQLVALQKSLKEMTWPNLQFVGNFSPTIKLKREIARIKDDRDRRALERLVHEIEGYIDSKQSKLNEQLE